MKVENKPELQVSNIVKNIPEALSIYINQVTYDQKRKGKDLIVMSLGEAFFDIPMFDFKKLDFNRGYHYSDSKGIPELREKIAHYYQEKYQAKFDYEKEILVSAGSKPVIFFAMQATLNPGDEVLIHEPAWLSYQEQARLVGASPDFIPHDVPVEDFAQHFTDRTKMLIINNPNNPAGRVYSLDELCILYRLCRTRGIYLLVDEAYSDFVINESFHSMVNIVPDKDGIIVVNSLSKNMGMSGWRVGYVISTETLINEILKINQHVITCAPTILQFYLARYFDDIIKVTLSQVTEVVEKRARVQALIAELNLTTLPGQSTFYFMVSIDEFPGSSLDFALHMILEHQIAVVPGSAYGNSCERYVRVGIGAESEERIHHALLRIKDATKLKTFDMTRINDLLEENGLHPFVSREL